MIYSTKSQKSSLSSFLINPHFSNASSPSQKKVIFDEWHAKKWVQYICISILPFWLVHQFLGAQLALKAPSSPEGCNNADIRRMNGSKVSHCTTSSLEKCIPFHHEVKHNNSRNHKGLFNGCWTRMQQFHLDKFTIWKNVSSFTKGKRIERKKGV